MAGRSKLGLVVVLLVFGLNAGAALGTASYHSHVSIHSKGLTFSGNVTSSYQPCERRRGVQLYRSNGEKVGQTDTNHAGHWQITVQGSAGITLSHFHAKVIGLTHQVSRPYYRCLATQSESISVHP